MSWGVILRPAEGKNEKGKNTGGLVIYLVGSDEREYEVTRVAYVREASAHPELPFEDALQAELAKAYEAADAMNDAWEERQNRIYDDLERAAQRIRELLGDPPKVMA